MKTTNESIKFYLELIDNGSKTIYLQQENATNNIKTTKGNELIFSGTKKEVYKFLVGIYRIMCLKEAFSLFLRIRNEQGKTIPIYQTDI
jgi:hypothetical protein